jgi:hypothetical protein
VLRVGVLRARDARERVLDDVELESSSSCLVLCDPNASELGVGEDRCRQDRVVGFRRDVAEHVLGRNPGLVLGDRRELREPGHVAGGPDALRRRPKTTVYGDAGLRPLDARLLELELLDVGNSAGGK